jgi:ABC-type multidrug transport system fused ATPase/permease subunit
VDAKLFFLPSIRLFLRAILHPLSMKDLWRLGKSDSTLTVYEEFEERWMEGVKLGRPSLIKPILSTFGFDILICLLMCICQAGLQLTIPLLLPYVVRYLADPRIPSWHGYIYFVAIYVTYCCSAFLNNHTSFLIWRIGVRLRASLITLIYRKSLKLAPGALGGNSGSVVNLMSTDAQIVLDSLLWFIQGLITPLQFGVILGLLSRHIGNFSLISLGLLVLAMPIMLFTSINIGPMRLAVQMEGDQRIKLTTELITAVRIVKYYAWERPFYRNIDTTREAELARLTSFMTARAFLFIVLRNLSPLSIGLTIIAYALKNDLTIESAFAAIAYLNILRLPFIFFPVTITFLGQYLVSFGRISDFALLKEIELEPPSPDPTLRGGMAITEGFFSWPVREKDSKETNDSNNSNNSKSTTETATQKIILKNINLDVARGNLTMIVGSVGAGKSSLAMALLKEMPKVSGDVFVPNPIAYASQEPWIINTTIRQNILFGQPYDYDWYHEVVDRCCLLPDFAMFPAEDLTEVAERGANLSGGQRQRINLARAIYSRRDVYIFDDPFSAVDSHVGDKLFHNVVMNLKKELKTVLLITNQLHFIPNADMIIVMKKGKIAEQGPFKQLMTSKGEFSKLARDQGLSSKLKPSTPSITSETQIKLKERKITKDQAVIRDVKNMEKGKLISEEEMERGAISLSTYWSYIYSNNRSLIIFSLMIGVSILRSAARVGGSIWISRWVNPSTSKDFTKSVHVGAYGGILAGEVIFGVFYTLIAVAFSITASRQVHRRLIASVIRATTRFFDTTPIGRLLARFSKDINIVDNTLPNQLEATVDTFFQMLAVFANLATGTPYAIIIVGVVLILMFVLIILYRQSASQLQRIESLTRAPIYTHFNESIEGIATIRAYNMQSAFEVANLGKIDRNTVAFLGLRRLSSWFSLVCEQIGAIGVGGIVLMLILFRNYSPKTISIGLAANALSNAVGVLSIMSAGNQNLSEMESRMNSIERINQYQDTEQEAAYEIPETEPGEEWPNAGEIDFDELQVEYTPGVPVLRGIEAKIHAREKIGIIGRTGAGKSTLITTLFRTTEPSSGRVLIDGVDIASLGLGDLRSKLSIIPQVPQLFMGTVRYNLDPFEMHQDAELWRILKRVKLIRHVRSMPGGLDAVVEENGSNFSVGQRQLISMARCLLRNTRVLLLDEATASLDPESDALLQKMIRKYFHDKTVLTIAHRIITVIDSDRILVLDAGKVAEFDTPSKLLDNPNGILYSMVQATGAATASHLTKIARGQATVGDTLLLNKSLAESSTIVETII